MSNIYKDQARDLANIPILRRNVIACVHLEDKDDMVFWDLMLQSRRTGKYHFVTHSKSQSGKETTGSTQCLRFRPYLSRRFFIGIDNDNTEFAKSVDFEAESNYCQTLNVNEQNAYLHIRGHNLFDLVAYIGDLLCRGTSVSFKKDVLINDLPPQIYWQIQNITKDLSTIIQ